VSIRAENRLIRTIGLTAARPVLIRPLRDRLTSAASGVLALLAVALPIVLLLALLLASAALAWEMIGWWKAAGVLMPGPGAASVDWAPGWVPGRLAGRIGRWAVYGSRGCACPRPGRPVVRLDACALTRLATTSSAVPL
jgi:hypothetical protein